MKKYFEYNLPDEAPYWLHVSVIPAFDQMLSTVKARMEKLELALEYTGLTGETFSMYAKPLFDANPDRFDSLLPEEIGEKVLSDYEFEGKREAEHRMTWPNAEVVIDTAFVSRKEWESLRFIGIGGSEAAIIRGVSHYQTETDLYHRKIGTPEREPDTSRDWIFDRGHALEENVINAFCKSMKARRVPETRMFRSKKYPTATANIDSIVILPGGEYFVFEAKTTIAENWEAWSNDKIPVHYIPQMRQYPGVLDDPRIAGTFIGCLMTVDYQVNGTYVGSTITNAERFPIRFLPRDRDVEEEIMSAEEDWYNSYVCTNTLPPISGNPDKEIRSVARFIPAADKTAPVQAWNLSDHKSQIEEYMSLSEKKSTLAAKVKEIEDAMKTLSVEMIEELGANVEANIDLPNNEYYEIKNSPRISSKVDSEMLRQLIHLNAPVLEESMYQAMLNCFDDNYEKCRVFSVKKKVRKVKKTKKSSVV